MRFLGFGSHQNGCQASSERQTFQAPRHVKTLLANSVQELICTSEVSRNSILSQSRFSGNFKEQENNAEETRELQDTGNDVVWTQALQEPSGQLNAGFAFRNHFSG